MAVPSTKPFSISFSSSKSKPAPAAPSKKRPHSALAEPDSDHEEGSGPQIVTGFDQSAGGAIATSAPQINAPLVIQSEKNRNWREESRRKRSKNILPAEVQAQKNGVAHSTQNVERDEISKISGLQFIQRDEDGDVPMASAQKADPEAHEHPNGTRTADEEALQALLGAEKKSTLVLPTLESTYENGTTNGHDDTRDYTNEDDRFKADVASRPESASLDDYARIPVEEFGPALLRGMGWKEGQAIGKRNIQVSKPRVVERRPALLGIGAKEAPGGVGEELGAWGKSLKGKRKPDPLYNPVVLKNSKTGEMLTEEELEAKKSELKKGKEELDWRERRDRNLAVDAGRKGERREKEKELLRLEEDSGGSGFRRRERSRSGERSRHSLSRRRERSQSPGRSGHNSSSSRRKRSRSREEKRKRRDHGDEVDRRERDGDRHREREGGGDRKRDRDKDRGGERDKDRDRDRDRGGGRDSERGYRRR